jgi:ABC-type sugar transport system substrate-binding protein
MLAALALPALLACASAPSAADSSLRQVVARSTPDGIEVTNQTTRPVFYTAIEEGVATFAAVTPCIGRGCDSVDAGEQVVVPWSKVAHAAARNDFMLYWCHEVRDSLGIVPRDSVHSLLVPR